MDTEIIPGSPWLFHTMNDYRHLSLSRAKKWGWEVLLKRAGSSRYETGKLTRRYKSVVIGRWRYCLPAPQWHVNSHASPPSPSLRQQCPFTLTQTTKWYSPWLMLSLILISVLGLRFQLSRKESPHSANGLNSSRFRYSSVSIHISVMLKMIIYFSGKVPLLLFGFHKSGDLDDSVYLILVVLC